MKRSLVRRAVVFAAVTAAAVGLSSASSEADPQFGRLDLTSIAIPTLTQPQVTDSAFDIERLRGWQVDAQTSAAATSDCDGCSAVATTLAIIYADGGRSRTSFDNVATSWNTCVDCSATTVSVQVVVLRRAGEVTANNRALALNAACVGCRASAAAYQLVVVEPRGRQLSQADVEQLRAWVADQATALSQPAPRALLRSSAPEEAPLDGLEEQLGTALGGITALERSAKVDRG